MPHIVPYWGHKIYNFVDLTLVILTLYSFCLIYAQEQRRRFLYRNTLHLHFLPQILFLPGIDGHEINNFSCPYPTDHTNQIWSRLTQ